LVTPEPETYALTAWVAEHEDDLVSSDLMRTELLRFALRASPSAGADLLGRANRVVDGLDLLPLSRATYRAAGLLAPAGLRTLDALHLAVALELGDDLDGVVTYDERLAQAAAHWGVPTLGPTGG
jgi:predicted nucleic acid-binding protein